MKIKGKHINFVRSGVSYLPFRKLPGDDHDHLKGLYKYAREHLGVRSFLQKTLSGPRERTTTALRSVIILGKDFDKRPFYLQIKVLRHEMAHILQQRKHGVMFWLRYLSAPWRWAYETAAECEAVRSMAERGWKDDDLKQTIDRFAERVFTSKTWALKSLDSETARKLTAELLWDAVKHGRR